MMTATANMTSPGTFKGTRTFAGCNTIEFLRPSRLTNLAQYIALCRWKIREQNLQASHLS
jgi:hypothetical protein